MPPVNEWFTSSYSAAASNNCVEVRGAGSAVGVRDSKRVDGGTHRVAAETWRAFVGAVRRDRF